MKIVRNVRAALRKEKSFRKFKEKDYLSAIEHLNEVKKLRPLKIWEMAYSATLQIGAENSVGAKKQFHDTLIKIEELEQGMDDPKIKYVLAYCQTYVSLIRSTDDHMIFFEKALRIDPGETIAEFLPLPDKEVMLGFLPSA